ncbi:MAG TPA: fibronectin type III domain-containing protein, partial [Nakamurella sp.]
GGSPITSYTVTPYIAGVAQPATTVSGNPPATSTTVTGLTNGTAYTFTVTATNAIGTGPASALSNSVTPSGPTAPGAPTGVTAVAGNASATVSWTAPANGGSPITSYTVTPYVAGVAQPVTNVGGNPPATSVTVTGLTNGTAYTFTVAATNAVNTGPASAPSAPVTPVAVTAPVFVQQTSARKNAASLTLTPTQAVTAGNRLIVQVGVWSATNATASAVTDSAGNTYTKLAAFTASDHTEMSVWSAPVTAGGGTKPTVTVTATGSADIGASLVEYAGLSTAGGTAAVDQSKTATGNTSGAATVSSAATAATTAGPELAVGFYADSGFGDTLTAGSGWTPRVNVSPTTDMELLVEDQTVAAGATPNATIGTGGNTPWLAATIVFKHG